MHPAGGPEIGVGPPTSTWDESNMASRMSISCTCITAPGVSRRQRVGYKNSIGPSGTEFAISLKLRFAPSERCRRARRGPERGTPDSGRDARVRPSRISSVAQIGRTKPSCGRSVASIRATERREGDAVRPGGPMQSEHVGSVPTLLGITNCGGGRDIAAAPLLLERGSVYPIPGGRRPGLLLPTPIPLWAEAGCTGGQDGEGLGPQELRPGRSDPPRRRSQTTPA